MSAIKLPIKTIVNPRTQMHVLTPHEFEDRLQQVLVDAVNSGNIPLATIIGTLECHKLRMFQAMVKQHEDKHEKKVQ